MTVDKFSVSLPEELVVALDELAADEGLTRSGVLREAASRYVASREAEERRAERRRRVDSAIAAFDDIADEWGADERSGVDYLREIRGDLPASEVGTADGEEGG